MPLSIMPYQSTGIARSSVTINVCPTKAATTSATNKGPIGFTLSGLALFNPFEGVGDTPALSDNVSYTFTDSAGKKETASFIDACNSHAAATMAGSTWHYHGVPSCLVVSRDGATGPSHLIGFALDGFPIYGGRDTNGNVIPVSKLDACNGITSATPEFPNGIYHYVLPIGVTGKRSSLNCYSGAVTQQQMALARTLMCRVSPLPAVRRVRRAAPVA
jgi:hypothetical protein